MQFRDLKKQYEMLKTDMDTAIFNTINECNFISGSQVTELENELADFIGVKHCITCANGTDALSLALMAWNIGKGDAVFVPDFTFFASAEVVSYCGATPVFVDIDEDTFNMSAISLEKAIIEVLEEGKLKPRVIIPVDLFGLTADYINIKPIAKKYDLLILEDGAQGFGGSINNKKACSFGDISTTSFFPAKPLGCYGDGGALFTDNSEIAELLRSLCVHGKGKDKYDNIRIGLNSRLDTIQAAILRVKLKAFKNYELNDINEIAGWYMEYLEDSVKIPYIPEKYYSSWAQFTITLKSKIGRDGLQKNLKDNGIPSMIYYNKPMHKQSAFSHEKCYVNCTVSDRICDLVLSIPIHPYLSRSDVEFISNVIENY